jgi:DNA-directed RNA polymerase beta subunit
LYQIVENVCSRKVTGNAALDYIAFVLANTVKTDTLIVESVIKRDLDCGVQESTINKVWKDLIKDPPYMSYSLFNEKLINSIKLPCYSEIKQDGLFADVKVTSDSVNYSSRSGKDLKFKLPEIIENKLKVLARLGNPYVLHGEALVIAEDGSFEPREIGKITPKGESDPSPEEKLLRAIFGDKAGDVKDASLKASPSLRGVVIDKKLYSRVIKTRSEKNADKAILPKLNEEFEEKAAALKAILIDKLLVLTADKVSQGVKDYLGTEVIAKGAKFTKYDLESLDYTVIQLSKWTADAHKNDMIRDLIVNYLKKYKELDAELKRKKFALTIGDELPSGIIQMAKVYIAKKRKIGVGDKMAVRWSFSQQ